MFLRGFLYAMEIFIRPEGEGGTGINIIDDQFYELEKQRFNLQ
jgi:hypothetical protein